jgi:bifunctional non-homologous end joining protein LigD
VKPELVCEVRYTDVTSAGLLRQPVFLGLRDHLAAADCVAPPGALAPPEGAGAAPPEREGSAPPQREGPAPPAGPRDLKLTRLDKVFWPVEGYTKGDLLAYYEAVWPWLAPYLRDRPLVLTRYPDGIEGKHFYQKNAPEFTPDWVLRAGIDGTDYFICNELPALLYVVNSGAIPLHVWSARLSSLDRPDWLILDLDPKEAPFQRVVEVARAAHAMLRALRAPHHVKTSGQAGLHVMLPLGGALDHEQAKLLGEVLARALVAQVPHAATVTRPLSARGGKVYVDFLQNGRGKLIAAPLSVRPRPHAPVSMPLRWSRVTARLDPTRFTIRTAVRELERHGDPLRPLLEESLDVGSLVDALA